MNKLNDEHPRSFSTLFHFINVVFTLPAQCSYKPSQATTRMGLLQQTIFILHRVALSSHPVQPQKTQGWTVSAGRWLQHLSAALSITKPRGSHCETFSHQHSNTIDCPKSISRKKH